jgi:hypothetical protein
MIIMTLKQSQFLDGRLYQMLTVIYVARVRHRGDRPLSGNIVSIWQIWGDKEFLSFISGKMKWESPHGILITKNPNWSQRWGTETGCVNGRY